MRPVRRKDYGYRTEYFLFGVIRLPWILGFRMYYGRSQWAALVSLLKERNRGERR